MTDTNDLDLKANKIVEILQSPKEILQMIGKITTISVQNKLAYAVRDHLVKDRRVTDDLLQYLADVVSYPSSSKELVDYINSEKSVFIREREPSTGDATWKYLVVAEFEYADKTRKYTPRFEIVADIAQNPRIIQAIVVYLGKTKNIVFCRNVSTTKAEFYAAKNSYSGYMARIELKGERLVFSFDEKTPADFVDQFMAKIIGVDKF